MANQLSAREQVDQILAGKEHREGRRENGARSTVEDREKQRARKVAQAKNSFLATVVQAAKNGNPDTRLLELDEEGAPESYHPTNGRDELRSAAYQDFWDFVVTQGFRPRISNYANEDGVGSWNAYHTDSDWIICDLVPM